LDFVKYQGLGNDFIILDRFTQPAEPFSTGLVRALCRRGVGVGADGVILAQRPSGSADARMIIYNSDGSEAEMCGNGIRCLAAYLNGEGMVAVNPMWIETQAGIKLVELLPQTERPREVRVDMGLPEFHRPSIPMLGEGSQAVEELLEVGGERVTVTCLSMGNPHCVVFAEDIDAVPFESLGPTIEHHPIFPRRTNVEFVQVEDEGHVRVKVWERGVGPTLACGTGACAAFAATLATRGGSHTMQVELPGGSLTISRDDTGHIFMTGPILEVYRGSISQAWLNHFSPDEQ
jgi:diaminopimelate epimerase